MPELPETRTVHQLKKFFAEHDTYTINEMALRYGVTPTTIRRWMNKCGMKRKQSSYFKSRVHSISSESEPDKEVWCTKAWFERYYYELGYGAERIARIINRHKKVVQKYMIKFGIKARPLKDARESKNVCCQVRWLQEHYVRLGKSLSQCAKEAGVNKYTITNWLIKFGMLPRDRHAAGALTYIKLKNGTSV